MSVIRAGQRTSIRSASATRRCSTNATSAEVRTPAATFADYACTKLRTAYTATQHRVTNTSVVSRDGDVAVAESYVLAFHVEESDRGRFLHTFSGRWIDRFERRDDGPWLIAERVLRVDWTRKDEWDEDMAGAYVPSARDRSDPVYGVGADGG